MLMLIRFASYNPAAFDPWAELPGSGELQPKERALAWLKRQLIAIDGGHEGLPHGEQLRQLIASGDVEIMMLESLGAGHYRPLSFYRAAFSEGDSLVIEDA